MCHYVLKGHLFVFLVCPRSINTVPKIRTGHSLTSVWKGSCRDSALRLISIHNPKEGTRKLVTFQQQVRVYRSELFKIVDASVLPNIPKEKLQMWRTKLRVLFGTGKAKKVIMMKSAIWSVHASSLWLDQNKLCNITIRRILQTAGANGTLLTRMASHCISVLIALGCNNSANDQFCRWSYQVL